MHQHIGSGGREKARGGRDEADDDGLRDVDRFGVVVWETGGAKPAGVFGMLAHIRVLLRRLGKDVITGSAEI